MAVDKKIQFFHGNTSRIEPKITDGTINESDFFVSANEDILYYIDENKTPKPLGAARLKEPIEVKGSSVGGIKDGSTLDAGMTLDQILKKMLQKSIPASYNKPGLTLTATDDVEHEVGSSITTTLTSQFTQRDAGPISTLKITDSQGSVLASVDRANSTSVAQTFDQTDADIKFKSIASYAQGPEKTDNLGDPSPAGRIEAGSIETSKIFRGFRNMFYGTGVGSIPSFDSSSIRALTNKKKSPANGTVVNISVAVGQQYVVFAYPENLRDVSQVMYVETNDTGMATSFTKQIVSVEGAEGKAAKNYKVYTYGMATPAAAPMTFKITI